MITKKCSIKTGTEEVTDIDFELWVLLDHARSVLSRSRELELAQYGLTTEQAGVLHTLLNKGGSATNSEIAGTVVRAYNSVTTLVNRMEKLGLVAKDKSPQDRKYLVTVTDKGRGIYEKVTRNSIRMSFSDLSAEDKQKFLAYLTHIIKKSRDMLGMDKKLPFLM